MRVVPTVGWLLVILAVTLRPVRGDVEEFVRLCVLCGEAGVPNILLNVALYMPLGFALRSLSGSWLRASLLGASVSFGVEVAQLWIPGRHSTLIDFASNSSGAALGAALSGRRDWWLSPSNRLGPQLASLWAGFISSVLLIFALIMQPSVTDGPLYAQWTPVLGTLEAYSGEILQATVGEIEVGHGGLERVDELRASLYGAPTIRVRYIVGEPPTALAPILRLVDDVGNELFQLGADGVDLVVRFRYRADDLKLARPDIRLRDALHDTEPGDTVWTIVERPARGPYRLVLPTNEDIVVRAIPAARGWSMLRYPGTLTPGTKAALDVLWLVLLFAPIGYWAPTWFGRLLSAALPLVAMAALPHVTQILEGGIVAYSVGLGAVWLGSAIRSTAPTKCGPEATVG